MHIYAHTCTHIYMCIHMHTYAQIENLSNDTSTSQAISLTHIRIHVHMHAYTHIYVYTHMCTTCSECVRRCVRWCKKNTCVTYTPAHALVPKTSVPKCMQHSLLKNAHTYIHMRVLRDFRWFIHHLSSVVKSAGLNKFGYPKVPGSVSAENTSTQLHMDLSK